MNQREIKFRVWDIDLKGWIIEESFVSNDGRIAIVRGLSLIEHQRAILSQFTGLLDKNGKEIYEGDIIKYETYFRNTEVIREVEWSDGTTGFDPFADYDADCDIYVHGKDVEVIGNIYENPELLKV